MSGKDVVIVTGSSGFIGSALIEKLAGRYALVGFDRIFSRTPPTAAECICIDLTDDKAVRYTHRAGQPTWWLFFTGGPMDGGKEDKETDLASLQAGLSQAIRGVTLPWPLVVTTLLGVWLMFTRLAFGTEAPMADSDHLAGSLVVTISIIAMAEVARPLRFLNVPAGLWLIGAPWLLEGGSMAANIAGALVGLAIVVLSLPRGVRSEHHYGRWDRLVV